MNTLAGALYKVFCALPDKARNEMRQACYDYLCLGGLFSSGSISLLSSLNSPPLSLVLHFFAVAIYGVGHLLLPFPSPKRIWIGARLISGASGIIFLIIRAEWVRQMFFPATVRAYITELHQSNEHWFSEVSCFRDQRQSLYFMCICCFFFRSPGEVECSSNWKLNS